MKNVLVFFGGESCEHDVSVITGVMAFNAIDTDRYNPIAVYVAKNGRWYTGDRLNDVSAFKNLNYKNLQEVAIFSGDKSLYRIKRGKIKSVCEIYSAVNCCHGGSGEGGGLYSVLKLSGIPCTSASEFASALAMDKEFTKLALKSIGVRCLPCVRINRENYYLKSQSAIELIKAKIGFPLIVKPSKLGSSIGITVASDLSELERALAVAFTYDEKVIVERAMVGFREINCAAKRVGGEIAVSECEEPAVSGQMLTFDDKYKLPAEKEFPAKIDAKISNKIKEVTSAIYKRLGFSGVIRVDFIVCDDEVLVNEINAVPGSLAYYLFCKSTEEFSVFLSELIEESVDEAMGLKQNKTTFESGILNLSSGKIHK